MTGRMSSLKYAAITLIWVIKYVHLKSPAKSGITNPLISFAALAAPKFASGIINSVKRNGASMVILALNEDLKNMTSYSVMIKGKVKAFSFVFIARSAHAIERMYDA